MLVCVRLALVRITNISEVARYGRRYRGAAERLKLWQEQVTEAKWSTPHDAQREMSGVTPIGGRRLVFKIKGNHYRLVAFVNYELGTVHIRFFGTHAEYDDIEAKEV